MDLNRDLENLDESSSESQFYREESHEHPAAYSPSLDDFEHDEYEASAQPSTLAEIDKEKDYEDSLEQLTWPEQKDYSYQDEYLKHHHQRGPEQPERPPAFHHHFKSGEE